MVAAIKTPNEINAEAKALRDKRQAEQEAKERQKKGWYGLIYCNEISGQCSVSDFVNGEQKSICLGKTDEIIPLLKSKGINGENLTSVFQAVEDFRVDQKNQEKIAKAKNLTPRVSKIQSCHSNTKNPQNHIFIPPEESNRATFPENSPKNAPKVPVFLKKDKKLLELLKSLINRDIGIPTIHRELNEHGYAVPYRTVGRWVAQMRSSQLL